MTATNAIPWWKRKATASQKFRGFAVLGSIAFPAAVVWTTADPIGAAITSTFNSKAEARLRAGESLELVLQDLADPNAILNAILLVYLAWGAAVGAIGTGMRAYAHNDDDRKGLDLAGKLLAVSAAVIVAVGSLLRVLPAYGPRLPAWIFLVVVLLAVVLIGLSLWVGDRVKADDLRAKKGKDAKKDSAIIAAAVSQAAAAATVRTGRPQATSSSALGLSAVVAAAAVALVALASRRR